MCVLRKQAKKLARDIAAGHADAIARARAQLPNVDRPLTQRNAQLVIAREYGYAGWQDLTAEVSKRVGHGLEWGAAQARRVIHDNDVGRLKQLLAEYPALLSWHGDDDDGAVVTPSVVEGLIASRARGLLQLFQRKGLLPRTLKFFSALGDLDAVRASLDENGKDLPAVNEAFMCACSFEHEAVASVLLERSIALDAELGKHVDGSGGRLAFMKHFIENRSQYFPHATPAGPWQVFLMQQVMRAVHPDGDLTAFVNGVQREPWLLGEACVGFQAELIGRATLNDRGNSSSPWFDESGAPRLGDLDNHYPYNDPRARGHLQWDTPTAQQVLDMALAFSVINRHFDVADFLLEHGADINTTWNSHEPASILHHLVFEGNYDSMRFLIDRGIDMTIKDYRWNSTAQGWALYGKKDQKMAQWLEDAERQRELRR